MRCALLFGALLLLVLGAGCTPAPPIQEDGRRDLAEAEGDFDPLAQDQERPIVIVGPEENSGPARMAPEDQRGPEHQEDSIAPGRVGVTKGYRVQIFLSDELREAARVMAEARERFQEEVYLEYDAPYYKVRVGDCQTESEGQRLLKVARRLGYQDAWLVTTVISVAEEPGLP